MPGLTKIRILSILYRSLCFSQVQIAPRVPVGQRFSPTSGEVLLCGKLRKDSGPVPTSSSAPLPASSSTLSSTLLPTSSSTSLAVSSSTLSSALLPISSSSTSQTASSTFTNGDFLALMWSAIKLECLCLGGVDFGDGHVCDKYYEIMSMWLLHVATVGRRTSHAVLAKCQRLEKKFKTLEKAYNRRPTEKTHNELYKFLGNSLDWQLSDLRARRLDEEDSITQSHLLLSSPALVNVPIIHNVATPKLKTETPITKDEKDSEEIIPRQGKALLSQDTVDQQKEKEKLIREVNKQTKKATWFEKQASDLSTAISKGMHTVVREAADLKQQNTELFEKQAAVTTKYRDLKRTSVQRSVHEKTIGRVVVENKELKRDNMRLSLELENEKLDKKIYALQKKSNRLRMSSTRKGMTLEQTKVKALAAIDDLRLDKEASEEYNRQILKLLEAEVADGKKTREELQREIDAIQQIETKNGGVYTARIRLMYCDLLAKGVSANIIQSVVQSVLHGWETCRIDTEFRIAKN